jgi:hypothetical protein
MELTAYNGQKMVLKCSYCGGEGILTPGSKVHRKGEPSLLYVCKSYPACDSYVGCHASSLLPMGTMANKRLRKLRQLAHEMFDPLWQETGNELGRSAAYAAAALVMGLENEFHIGNLDEKGCEEFIDRISLVEIEMDRRIEHHHLLGAPPDPLTIEVLHTLFHPDRDTFLKHVPLKTIVAYEREWTEAQRCGLVTQDRYQVFLSPKGQGLVFDATT